jgi:hypothetical protein
VNEISVPVVNQQVFSIAHERSVLRFALAAVRAIRYNLHFFLLTVAAFVLWWAKDLDLPARVVDYRLLHFGLIGFLHALAVVISLREIRGVRPLAALCFVALAAAWSAATPILAGWTFFVWFPIAWLLPRALDFGAIIFIHGSAVGASGYWLLIRHFWIKSLRRGDLFKTLVLCMATTLLVTVAGNAVTTEMYFKLKQPENLENGNEWLISVAWWFAFSLSLYWSETRTKTQIRNVALGITAFVLALGVVMWFFEESSFPLSLQAQSDQTRLSDLKGIAWALHESWEDAQYRTVWEYPHEKTMEWKDPTSLKDAAIVLKGLRISDPATAVPYEYIPLSGSAYKLCATFDSDSSGQDALFIRGGWGFSKGRQCFDLDASKSPY